MSQFCPVHAESHGNYVETGALTAKIRNSRRHAFGSFDFTSFEYRVYSGRDAFSSAAFHSG